MQLGAQRNARLGADKDMAVEAAKQTAGGEPALGRIETGLTVLMVMVCGLYVLIGPLGGPKLWLLLRIAAKLGVLG